MTSAVRRVLVVILILVTSCTAFGKLNFQRGGDIFLREGSTLLLNCSISPDVSQTLHVDNVTLSLGNTLLTPSHDVDRYIFQRFPDEGVLSLTVKNVTFTENGTFVCQSDNPNATAIKRVHVDNPPPKPGNITCLSNNFLNMVCWFDIHPEDTTNGLPTTWSLEYKKNLTGEIYEEAKCQLLLGLQSRYECQINNFSRDQAFLLVVKGIKVNPVFTVTVNETVFTSLSIVKPDPVRGFTLETTNQSTVIIAKWYPPDDLCSNLDYQMTLTSQWGTWTLDFRVINMRDCWAFPPESLLEIQKVFPELVPATRYHANISCRPVLASGDIYWSNHAEADITTPEDVPQTSTTLIAGGYLTEMCAQSPLKPPLQRVVLYWKNPSAYEANGNITGYEVEVVEDQQTPDTGHNLTTDTLSRTIEGSRFFFDLGCHFLPNTTYALEMWAQTKVGRSLSSSHLVMSAMTSESNIFRRVLVEADENEYFVTVQLSDVGCHLQKNITVFWCIPEDIDTNTTYTKCQSELTWKNLRFDNCVNDTEQTIPRPNSHPQLRFAAAIATETSTTSLKWESFRYKHNGEPEGPAFRVMSDENNGDRLVVIIDYPSRWDQSNFGKPIKLQLVYTQSIPGLPKYPVHRKGEKRLEFLADYDNTTFNLTGLTPGTDYAFWLRAINKGLSSSFSEVQIQRTLSLPDPPGVPLWIPVVSVFAGCLLIGLIVCCFMMFRRMSRRSKFKFKDIHVPTIEANSSLSNGYHNPLRMNSTTDTTTVSGLANLTIIPHLPADIHQNGTVCTDTGITKTVDKDEPWFEDQPMLNDSRTVNEDVDNPVDYDTSGRSPSPTLSGYLDVKCQDYTGQELESENEEETSSSLCSHTEHVQHQSQSASTELPNTASSSRINSDEGDPVREEAGENGDDTKFVTMATEVSSATDLTLISSISLAEYRVENEEFPSKGASKQPAAETREEWDANLGKSHAVEMEPAVTKSSEVKDLNKENKDDNPCSSKDFVPRNGYFLSKELDSYQILTFDKPLSSTEAESEPYLSSVCENQTSEMVSEDTSLMSAHGDFQEIEDDLELETDSDSSCSDDHFSYDDASKINFDTYLVKREALSETVSLSGSERPSEIVQPDLDLQVKQTGSMVHTDDTADSHVNTAAQSNGGNSSTAGIASYVEVKDNKNFEVHNPDDMKDNMKEIMLTKRLQEHRKEHQNIRAIKPETMTTSLSY